MPSRLHALLAAALTACAASSFAQSSTTPPGAQDNVGVSPSTGNEAMQKAVPRSDTATVIRTDESAADKARRAANATADAVTPGQDRDRSAATGTSAGTTTGSGTGTTTRPMRAARADRN